MSNHPNRNWRKRWPDEAASFVREWRTSRGLSQAELAALLDAESSKRTVQNWEAGSRTPPQYLRLALERLAQKIKAEVHE